MFLALLLQMAKANNIDMNSASENEEQLLMSDGPNSPAHPQHQRTPPPENEGRHCRVQRMNRREKEDRGMARNR